MESEKDLISVVIAAKDASRWINRTIDSLIHQTCDKWECLVSINGTSDNTREIVESYNNPKIRIIESPIPNKSLAINRAVINSKGSYIAILDSDDIWSPDKLLSQIKFIQNNEFDIVGTQLLYIDEDDRQLGYFPTLPYTHEMCVKELLIGGNPIANSSVLYKKDIHDKIGYYNHELFGVEDYDFWMKSMRAGLKFANMEERYLLHRVFQDSSFNSKKHLQYKDKTLVDHINHHRSIPLISVIIPCFRQGGYLEDAVGSLVDQTFKDWELKIVIDGCPDNSLEIATSLKRKYKEYDIEVLNKRNGGLADARNFGISHSRGRFILPLDADDRLNCEFLSKFVSKINPQAKNQIISCHLKEFGSREEVWEPPPFELNRMKDSNIMPYASLYNRELFNLVGGYQVCLPWGNEDYDFWMSCVDHSPQFHQIQECLFNYRIHSNGSMLSNMDKHKKVVYAMTRILHSNIWDLETCLQDHAKIGKATDETLSAVDHKIRLFGYRSPLMLFKGCIEYSRGEFEDSMNSLKLVIKDPDDNLKWQALWLTSKIYNKLGNAVLGESFYNNACYIQNGLRKFNISSYM